MKKQLPEIDVVRKLVSADFSSGCLTWLPRKPELFKCGQQTAEHSCAIWNGRYANKEAFTAVDSSGYRIGSLFDVKVRAHTVIWALYFGTWPESLIDHINQNRLDNRICNLRLADKSKNALNSKLRSDNTSGHRGVTWNSSLKKWVAQATRRGKKHHLGVFVEIENAIAVRHAFDLAHGD